MSCRICNSSSCKQLINFNKQPIVHNLLKRKDEYFDKHSMKLNLCKDCGFVYLRHDLEEEKVYQNYFTMSSWKDQSHSDNIFKNIKSFSDYTFNENVLEIGCNDGSFLKEIHSNGFKNIYGIEPAMDAFNIAKNLPFNIENGFFNTKNKYLDKYNNNFDLIISRHVLEHISDLNDFFTSIHQVLKKDGLLVIEVPDFQTNLDYTDYALWEEHVNYFTIETLNILFGINGFRIFYYDTAMYTGRAITVYAQKSEKILYEPSADEINMKLKYGEKFIEFRENFHSFLNSYDKTIVYGCGAKSSFLTNILELNQIEFFIDDQKEKLNLFVPGLSKKIVSWEEKFSNYLTLLGVNFENETKVIKKRNLQKNKSFSLLPPSNNIPSFWINNFFKGTSR